ncbi:MAG: mechanosensitive ion channel family protein [Nitrospinota bacterium]|nr:mechanosensitive ion channel family protein [Nitrospinota bacterium]
MLELIHESLKNGGVPSFFSFFLSWFLTILIVSFLAVLSNLVAKRVLIKSLIFITQKSKNKWDDTLSKHKAFDHLSHFFPALVVYLLAPAFSGGEDWVQRISLTCMIAIGFFAFNSFLNAVVDIYYTYDISREKPIKGYVQVVKIVLSFLVGIFILATMMDRSPWGLLSGLGAMTAILMFVFKDTLLGFTASLQLSFNDMVRVGDWIEMPKYGADGDIIDVSLHTVKVRNWDKTITTIPTHALVSDSFKNWRGMEISGGRRIKRAIYIDINSIKFCSSEMLDRFEKMQLLKEYIRTKKKEIGDFNRDLKIDPSDIISSRNLTNIGTFRSYIRAYLQNHPEIRKDMTFLIRQLQPTQNGLPMEIYVFSSVQDWIKYEGIQSDIMDHLFAALPEFGLRAFQLPSGSDFQQPL